VKAGKKRRKKNVDRRRKDDSFKWLEFGYINKSEEKKHQLDDQTH
jgi:hypothetical protein